MYVCNYILCTEQSILCRVIGSLSILNQRSGGMACGILWAGGDPGMVGRLSGHLLDQSLRKVGMVWYGKILFDK